MRRSVCADVWSAEMIRRHNDANMPAIGAKVVDEALALRVVEAPQEQPST
ncbi:MAG: hypothetical protein GC145_08130 [Caulobacter sp.]|nr:hypothetical protein [Caulobacter sp.]